MKLVNSVGCPRFSVWTKQDTNNASFTHNHTSSHQTLYNLANYLGALAMITVVAYHFVAVNARHVAQTH
ncbi:hypothetical protein L210DRAFT_558831 [Boletus edulis BED1]|uniref:Uncharacterized protein n=1 Tax=Boletus edulis BED1 TaxID=1328754 RepID=A0AAD4BA74_BOLED|nr:hypothetical protein L210DRAFT_558831 [Boletus edulis BED1]